MIVAMYARLVDRTKPQQPEPPIQFICVGEQYAVESIEITSECVRVHWLGGNPPATLIPFEHVYELIEDTP